MQSRQYFFAFAVTASALEVVSAHAATVQIKIDKMLFAPIEINASVGDTIEWVNNDILAHTATARNGDWDVTIAAKKTVTLVLKKAGAIDYYCRYHPNMKGKITIPPK